MRKYSLNLLDVKAKISEIRGRDIDVYINRGRKKIDNYSGIIEKIYPSVFTIKILNNKLLEKVTCSYSDVLCGDVKIEEK